jgi:hypothetical protein
MPDKESSRIGQLYHDLRRMPIFRQLAPMEAGIGWPIPVRHRPGWHDRTSIYVRIPLYGFGPQAGQTRLYPPFAVMTLAWPALGSRPRPLEYADLRFTQKWAKRGAPAPVGTFPHDAVRGTVADYVNVRRRLCELYDEMLDALQEEKPFTEPSYGEFGALLRTLMEPSLERYYRQMAPGFCREFLGPGDGS